MDGFITSLETGGPSPEVTIDASNQMRRLRKKVYSPTVQRGNLLKYRVVPASFQGFYVVVISDSASRWSSVFWVGGG